MAPAIRYIEARCRGDRADRLFRVYVTESLRLQGEGKYLASSYSELLEPRPQMDADDIVEYVASRLEG